MTDIFLHSDKIACFSDLHLGIHQNSSLWHKITLEWLDWFVDSIKKRGIKDIIFCGDWFHNRSEVSVNTLDVSSKVFSQLRDFNIIAITGNHDAYYRDRSDVNSLSVFKGWNDVTVLSELTTTTLFNKEVVFCPWGTTIDQIPKCDIIFGHFEIQTFKQNSYKVCATGMTSSDLLSKSNFIISGHFHLREQREYDEGTILYLGNPFQMDFGDAESTKGYYTLDVLNLDYEFTPNTLSPEHKKIYLSELVKIGSITDDVRLAFNNNFVRFVIDKNISPDEVDIVLSKLALLEPLSINVDYAINFNKYKIDDEQRHDFSGVDISTAIEEFIQLMDIQNKEEVTKKTLKLYRDCTI